MKKYFTEIGFVIFVSLSTVVISVTLKVILILIFGE